VSAGGIALETEITRSDAVTETSVRFADFWTIERLRANGVAPDELTPSGQQNERRQDVARRTLLPTTFLANAGHYRAVYVRILERGGSAPDAATPRAPASVVLFIDEVNRADLGRVFGELITLLEPDKRQGAPEERSVLLPYSQAELTVPANVHVLATMNTADRSLSVFDYALRRRFEFVYIAPDSALCPTSYGGVDVQSLLTRVNDSLAPLVGRNLLIGHAELMESKLEEERVRAGYDDDDDGRIQALARVLVGKTIPYLLECFSDDWHRVEMVLGRRRLLEPEGQPALTVDDEDEDLVDVADRAFRIASWIDIGSGSFDVSRVRAALSARTVEAGTSG
jgi:5-methylcytosine-specific restriction protein B